MRYLWKLLFVLLFSFLTSSAIYGQSVEQLYKAGLQSLQSGAYYAAEAYFKQALTKDDSRVEIWNNYAEAARLNNNYTTAIQAYEKVIQLDKTKAFPLSRFWLGSLLIYVQQYQEAIRQLESFRYDYRAEDFYAQKVRQLLESCAWALEHQQADTLS
ncbi:MAG: tetratricopeptide repeat protein, partial [Chitinophagales bacterium]|nr:tetratricopeptide repeat protein [Chitinophagales bacterium]